MKIKYQNIIHIILAMSSWSVCFSQITPVRLGGTTISLPSPIGFHEISSLSPEYRRLAELNTYKNNRLLAVYFSEDDVGRIMKNEDAKMSRYMLVQTMESAVKKKISQSQFIDFAEGMKSDQYKLWDQYKNKIQPWLENTSENISNEYDFIDYEMKIGEPVPLGVYHDTPEAFSFALLTKYSGSEEGNAFKSVVIGGSTIMLIKKKMLFVYVYANFNDQDDIDWVRSVSKSWIKSIQSQD
jgi:hypothetical protein